MEKVRTLEEQYFCRYQLKPQNLETYGFTRQGDCWVYRCVMMKGAFRAEIYLYDQGRIYGRVMETDLEEEYVNFRLPAIGEYAGKVKEEYLQVLQSIRDSCFERQPFLLSQSNRITNIIKTEFGVEPEFLWERSEGLGVFRNHRSGKWFAIIMNVDRSLLEPSESGETEVMNVKLDEQVSEALKIPGIYPAYHMSKKNWVTIQLNETLSDQKIMEMIRLSYQPVKASRKWLIPANPKYYDIIGAFERSEVIDWKQSSNILPGDIVYMYVGSPHSAILFKCEVLETDIPYDYADENLTIRKLMKIRLLRRYEPDRFSFAVLNSHGVKAVRGPRGIPESLVTELEKE